MTSPPGAIHPPDAVRARVLISGRVQGVFFRRAAFREVASLPIDGFVRNLADGRVEAAFQGPRDVVERLIEWCRIGPDAARVDEVDVIWEPPRSETRGFRIL